MSMCLVSPAQPVAHTLTPIRSRSLLIGAKRPRIDREIPSQLNAMRDRVLRFNTPTRYRENLFVCHKHFSQTLERSTARVEILNQFFRWSLATGNLYMNKPCKTATSDRNITPTPFALIHSGTIGLSPIRLGLRISEALALR